MLRTTPLLLAVVLVGLSSPTLAEQKGGGADGQNTSTSSSNGNQTRIAADPSNVRVAESEKPVAKPVQKPVPKAVQRPAARQVQTSGSQSGLTKARPNLTGSDCRLQGGTVVEPGDDRCGAVGAAYCRLSNGYAQCIEHK